MSIQLSEAARDTAGVLLLSVAAIAWGGAFVLRVARGREPAPDFQQRFYRAGHAHAGVLVTLGLVGVLLSDATSLSGAAASVARSGIPAAAILIPAGFFLSAAGRGRVEPGRAIGLLWLGVAALLAGVVTLGIGLLTA